MTWHAPWLRALWSRTERLLPKRDVWVVVYRSPNGRLLLRSEHPSYDEAVMVEDALSANPFLPMTRYAVMNKENFDAANREGES